jgi:SAM-dependent methyltransferase
MSHFNYVGSELEVFSQATNWKNYYRGLIDKFIGRDVLEVGAGIGATAEALCARRSCDRWVCLEPDAAQASRVSDLIAAGRLPQFCSVQVGTLADLPGETFDTLLYVDVLEHIKDDARQLSRAAERLRPGGHLVVLSPAHQRLYTPFDAAVGHYRRYNKASLRAVAPAVLRERSLFYADAVGALASLGNLLLLKSEVPSGRQIFFWDKVLVPASKIVDPLLRYKLGKTIIGVWKKK